MKRCYINGIGCVSAQDTSSYEAFIDSNQELVESFVKVYKPNYRGFIKPAFIRRMASGVKNGVVAASLALKDANVEVPQAIITGTGMGCLIDSEKFLKNIVDNDEQFLTPTSFIQSTHNTVGGQVALGLKCKAYNVTYAHNATSFETSLIDALLIINEGGSDVLVGAIDEVAEYTLSLYTLIGHVKKQETLSSGTLKSNSKGAVFSEGAQFFSLESEKKENSYAELLDVEIYDVLKPEMISKKMVEFLGKQSLTISDIDVVLLGKNGDVDYDHIYTSLQEGILEDTQQLYYKHLSGEYNTVSAFGLWLASQICKTQKIPDVLKLNSKEQASSVKYILLYNQYLGESHSFTLLKSC